MKTGQISLASRPLGKPTLLNFTFEEIELGNVGEGEVLVRNLFLSVDPYMRGRMNETKSYIPPFSLHQALAGGAVGSVVESKSPRFKPGDFVIGTLRWRNFDIVSASSVEVIEKGPLGLSVYLGVLGMPGLTAYVGLLDVGRPNQGDTVFVSGAAGAVGSLVGQIAKIKGCRTIGSAGGPQKVKRLEGLGFDVAIDYKSAPIGKLLAQAAPNGVDVFFDNVGGDHLTAGLEASNDFGRIVLCGAISQYNAQTYQPGPGNIFRAIQRRLTLQGFIVSDHADRRSAFLEDATQWISEGKLSYYETFVDGLERAPEAFLGLFDGANLGKMLVRMI